MRRRRSPVPHLLFGRLAAIVAVILAVPACDYSFSGLDPYGDGPYDYDHPMRQPAPEEVAGDAVFTMIAAGTEHVCGARADDVPLCWGARFGATPSAPRGVPRLVSIASSFEYSCGIDAAGRVHCWSASTCWNAFGTRQVCEGEPLHMPDALRFQSIATGAFHACGILEDQRAVCWGQNTDGRLGTAVGDRSLIDVHAVESDARFMAIDAGATHTCALATDGVVHCWGANIVSQTGSAGVQCEWIRCTPRPTPVDGDHRFVSIALGENHSCAIDAAGTTWCWGFPWPFTNGAPGANGNVHAPMSITGGIPLVRVSGGLLHTCGLTGAGLAFCWGGDNAWGERGTVPMSTANSPVAVDGGRAWQSLSAGHSFTCALDADGHAWCWGMSGPQLGRG